MTDLLETTLQLPVPGHLRQSSKLDEADPVAPSTPVDFVLPAAKLSFFASAIDEAFRAVGVPIIGTSYTRDSAQGVTGQASIADMPALRDTESAGKSLPSSPMGNITAGELYAGVYGIVAEQTHLSESVSALITFWAFSTWFQDVLTVAPCLVITGPAHEASVVLRTLDALCCRPMLMAEMSSAVLRKMSGGLQTLLSWTPNLDKRTAALIGSSTTRGFMVHIDGNYPDSSGSKAIYAGDAPPSQPILHSIQVAAAAAADSHRKSTRQLSDVSAGHIRNQFLRYRGSNLADVGKLEFIPSGLTSELAAIANALGSCIVDAPELQAVLVDLLTPLAQQQIADRADSLEALVVSAALALYHQGRNRVLVKEVAAEVNLLHEVRDETVKTSPEKVGHKLKQVGLATRRLSQAGNGLVMNRATAVLLHCLAATYRVEDTIEDDANLPCQLCTQNK